MTAGLRVMEAWADAEGEQEDALVSAVRTEPMPGALIIGLATVSRLLAIELAAATGRTEQQVLHQLDEVTAGLQRGHR